MSHLFFHLFISLISFGSESVPTGKCGQLLLGHAAGQSDIKAPGPRARTKGLIAYFEMLLQETIMKEAELSRFLAALEKGTLINPLLGDGMDWSSALAIHREALDGYLESDGLDLGRLRIWAAHKLKNTAHSRDERRKVTNETDAIAGKIEFNPVNLEEPFRVGYMYTKVEIKLRHRIEVMSTPLTQWQWVKLFGKNPSFYDGRIFGKGGESLDGTSLLPHHPVEYLTWWSAIMAANRISEEKGLQPAYDVSAIQWKPGTSFEKGTLEATYGTRENLTINAPHGDIYQAEGVRLPTQVEQSYLCHLEKRANATIPLAERAWHATNSMRRTHPVAQLMPLLVDGKAIYDLLGNVPEWSQNKFEIDNANGQNPILSDFAISDTVGVSGGGYDTEAFELAEGLKFSVAERKTRAIAGVRFVRSL